MRTHNSRSGFTLLEIIIVMAIVAALAGVIAPAAGSIMRSQRRRATIDELDQLAGAVQEFYRDTRVFPSGPLDLLGNSTPGWSGPYLRGTVDDPWSNQSGYVIDGFGNAYTFATSGLQMTITSDGPDRTNATSDDISLVVNVTPILRRMTLDELAIINTAVTQYNATYLSTAPLSGNYAVALSTLISSNYLPAGSSYDTDEFGDPYTGNPPGVGPLTSVTSPNVP